MWKRRELVVLLMAWRCLHRWSKERCDSALGLPNEKWQTLTRAKSPTALVSVDPWGCYIGQKRRNRRFPWGSGTYKMAAFPAFSLLLPSSSCHPQAYTTFSILCLPWGHYRLEAIHSQRWLQRAGKLWPWWVTPWHPPHREQAMFYQITWSPLFLCGCLLWVTLTSVLSSWCCIQFLRGFPHSPSTNYARVCSLPFSFFPLLWPHITLGWEELM